VKIAVSAGHYPQAQGAQHGALTEYVAATDWCASLKLALEQYGVDVFEVPTGQLTAKIGAINAEHCDAAIEVHFNADAARAGRGSETLYCPGSRRGEVLARAIQADLGRVLVPNRGAKEAWYRMDRPGHLDFPGDRDGDEVVDAFVRLTNCPAVIVEPCFIHEPGVLSARGAACSAIARALALEVASWKA
jgi:N-acetylmuramoyl-L-alanine amidase